MKKFLTIFAIFAALLCGAGSAFSAEYVEGEVLVTLEVPQSAMSVAASDMSAFASSMSAQADSFATSVGAESVQTYAEIARSSGKNIIHLRSNSKTTEQLMNELKNDPRVKSVSPNYLYQLNVEMIPHALPNDPDASKLWGMTKIGADKVWDAHTGAADKNDVVVAVIDSGIDYNHPDIAANMVKDSNGKYGWSAFNNNDPMDDNSHGTHVAGTIGAVGNNGVGVVGVNWKVGLLAVKVLGANGSGSNDGIIGGINYILGTKRAGMKVLVANLSLGGWSNVPNIPFGDAIKAMSDAGIIVALAAGNDYQNINSPGGPGSNPNNLTDYRGKLVYPAVFQYANTITVGATDNADAKSVFSNYSPNYVHIAAPGSAILSTVPVSKGSYGTMSGTSMATPHVAGATALLFSKYPTETATQIKARLLGNADQVGLTLWKHGRLNVKAAYDQGGGGGGGVTVTISPKPATVVIGGTPLQLNATVTGVNQSVTWSKQDGTGSITLSTSGLVTGVTAGTATVTATSVADPTKFDTVTVTVSGSGTGIIVALPGTATVAVGGVIELRATVTQTTDQRVTWGIRDGTGEIEGFHDGALLATITGVKEGQSSLIVTSVADNTKSATCVVTVTAAPAPIPSGGGGGCNAAPGLMFAVLLAVPAAALVLRKRK